MSVSKFEVGKQYRATNGQFVVKVLDVLSTHGTSYMNSVEIVYSKTRIYRKFVKPFSMFTDCWDDDVDKLRVQNIWVDLESRLLKCKL